MGAEVRENIESIGVPTAGSPDLSAIFKDITLRDYKTNIENQCGELESRAISIASKEIDKYISKIEMINGVRVGGISLRVDVYSMKCRKRDQEKRISGYLKNYIQKRVSLEDKECSKILDMLDGDDKSKAMDNFSKKVLREGIQELNKELKDTVNSMLEDVEYTLTERLNSIEETLNARKENYDLLRLARKSDYIPEVICTSEYNSSLYTHYLNLVSAN